MELEQKIMKDRRKVLRECIAADTEFLSIESLTEVMSLATGLMHAEFIQPPVYWDSKIADLRKEKEKQNRLIDLLRTVKPQDRDQYPKSIQLWIQNAEGSIRDIDYKIHEAEQFRDRGISPVAGGLKPSRARVCERKR